MSLLDTYTRYYKNSKRLLFKSTKKPTRQELKATSWITAIGIMVIGVFGLIINYLVNFIVST